MGHRHYPIETQRLEAEPERSPTRFGRVPASPMRASETPADLDLGAALEQMQPGAADRLTGRAQHYRPDAEAVLGLVGDLVLHAPPGVFEIRRNVTQISHDLRVPEDPVVGVHVIERDRPQQQPVGDERELYARTGLAAADGSRSASR